MILAYSLSTSGICHALQQNRKNDIYRNSNNRTNWLIGAISGCIDPLEGGQEGGVWVHFPYLYTDRWGLQRYRITVIWPLVCADSLRRIVWVTPVTRHHGNQCIIWVQLELTSLEQLGAKTYNVFQTNNDINTTTDAGGGFRGLGIRIWEWVYDGNKALQKNWIMGRNCNWVAIFVVVLNCVCLFV